MVISLRKVVSWFRKMGIKVKKVLVIVVSMVKVREFFGTSATNNVAIWGETTHGIEPTTMRAWYPSPITNHDWGPFS